MRTTNPAWLAIEEHVDRQIRKAGHEATKVERAQAIAKFLATPEGAELYAEGGGAHGLGFDPRLPANDDEVAVRSPVTKREAAWQKIKTRAEQIQKSANGGMGTSFSKAVDQVLRDDPSLYDLYIGR